MPSRAMMHTGRTLFHLQGAGESIPPEHATLGEAFRAAGYRTFGAGKWHNGRESFQRSFCDGDEIFFGGMADHWNVPVYHYDPAGRYDAQCRICPDAFHSNSVETRDCDHIHSGRHSSDVIADAAIRFIAGHDATQPFLAYVAFLAPHDPRTMPDEYRRMYEPDAMAIPPNFLDRHPFDNGALRVRDELLAALPRTAAETRRHIAEYYAMITHLDAQVGRIVDALERKGVLDDTIIVLAGDNGLALGQHGLFGKQSCYEHSVRVPLMFSGPGVPAGVRSDALVYLFDIFPTLCDLTGIAPPRTVEGASLAAAWRSGGGTGRGSLYFAYCGHQRAVRTPTHKLIEYVVDGRHSMTQLFDLVADPHETRNIAATPASAALLRDMRDLLRRHAGEWNDRESPWGTEFWPPYDASVAEAGLRARI
jgi:arylsulfatase A-like enzyme